MTTEQRFERIEQLHAEQIEMARQDRAASIAWKRDMESQVQATWKAIDRASKAIEEMAAENRKGFAEGRERLETGMAEMRREMAARDQVTDKRIADLVTAIGELIQRMDRK